MSFCCCFFYKIFFNIPPNSRCVTYLWAGFITKPTMHRSCIAPVHCFVLGNMFPLFFLLIWCCWGKTTTKCFQLAVVMSLVMMTDLLWFLHVEVVVAGKVGVQNEFLDFIVLRIKENVLKLSHLEFPPKLIIIVWNVVPPSPSWSSCKNSRSGEQQSGDAHLGSGSSSCPPICRKPETFDSKLISNESLKGKTFDGAPIAAITSCTESPNLSRADWLVLALRDKSRCFKQSSLLRRHEPQIDLVILVQDKVCMLI